MMNTDEQADSPEQQEHRELVAYLDGELLGEDRLRVEKRAGTDPDYRRRLVELEQSWNLLDALPVTEVDASFTQSTVTMAALAIESESTRWWTNRKGWLAGGVALSLGFVLVGLPLMAKRRAALRDIPVMNNMELYLHADSLEFLEMLEDEGIFSEVEDEL